ncbi:MAG: hypothetical protein GXP31_17770 [Kiritimatiellaeota bacterium]|nr:hypothetical protein [Kiritimatiellota bacterium]
MDTHALSYLTDGDATHETAPCHTQQATRAGRGVPFSLLLLSAIVLAGTEASAYDVTWENETTAIRISDGCVTSLFDKSRRVEPVVQAPSVIRPMFRVILNKGLKKAHDVNSTRMRVSESSADRDELRLTFESEQVRAVVRVSPASDRAGLAWRINVTPLDPGLSVARVIFPMLHLRAPLGKELAEDRIILPYREGHLIRDPLRGVGANERLRTAWPYPADMVGQFIGYFSNRAGCLLWTDDAEGRVKWFGFEREKNETGLVFFVDHRMPFEPGKGWQMPYNVRTSFFAKTWQAGAELYRAWAAKQFWCKTPFRDRDDISPVLHAPCLAISSSLRSENLDVLPHVLGGYIKRFKAPVVYRPLGWEKHGTWIGIDYFPPFPDEAKFRSFVAALKERGVYACAFISGLYWSTRVRGLAEEENAAIEAFYKKHRGADHAERLSNGKPLTFNHGGRRATRICRGTPLGRTILFDVSRRLLDLGITAIHDDQDQGPQPCGYTCYDTSHGHLVPCGSWAAKTMLDTLARIKREGATRSRDFFLTKEEDTELMNMVLSGYQTRNFARVTGYLPGRPMQIMPVTQYLYHEYLPCVFGFAGPWVDTVARMLVSGQIPSIAFWGEGRVMPVDALPPRTLMLLTDYYDVMRAYAKPFLLYGRMMAPLGMDIPTVRRKVGLPHKRMKLEVDDPLVITSAWRDVSGRIAVLAVNITNQPRSIRCITPKLTGESVRVSRYVGARSALSRKRLKPGSPFSWTIPPYRLCAAVYEESM